MSSRACGRPKCPVGKICLAGMPTANPWSPLVVKTTREGSVANAVLVEKVRPSHIVVISLDARSARRYLSALQRQLLQRGVDSTIPGLVDDSSEFAEEGRVTLSTVNRAKGNEAPVVYIL